MSNKYFGGVVENRNVVDVMDQDMKDVVTGAYDKVEKYMEEYRIADSLKEIFNVFKRLNKYIDETEPWNLAKDEENQDRLATVLYNLIEGISIGISLLKPFMPETADRIAKQLNYEIRDFDSVKEFGLYPSGNKVVEDPEVIFQRLDAKEVLAKVEVLQEKQRQEAAAAAARGEVGDAKKEGIVETANNDSDVVVEHKEEIGFDDFEKMEFRVGEIIKCEAVEKSKKLLCSQVKIGNETKQIVSGIRKYYSPEEMVGKKVMVLCNLKPAKLAGVLSEGMLLCAEDANGDLALMQPDKAFPSGSEIA
jgi:methionyl-tRNA synthetase